MKLIFRMCPGTVQSVKNLVLGIIVTCGALTAGAEPYASAGDIQLRHDIEYLADRNLLDVPVSTWPISWADLSAAMDSVVVSESTPESTYAVIKRIRNKLSQSASQWGTARAYAEISVADNRTRLRTFDDTARGTVEVGSVFEYTGNSFAGKLEVTLVNNAIDDRSFRLDGSYLGFIWKNVAFTVGSQEKWWGPGHAGSLILSNNARPVPAVAIRRHSASRFQHPWLRWIGPWSAQAFAGQLESGRAVSDAYLLGARIVFKPLRSLELGVTRTAQWGGEGRPQSFDNFIDLLLGQDNVVEGMSRAEEPGNQLAGFDARYSMRIMGAPLTLYGQVIGEDEAGGFPSRYLGLLGASTSMPVDRWASTVRINLEYSDSTCQFHEDSRLFNCAYNHPIYEDGYRYRGNSIGHSTDNDSRQTALIVTINTDHDHHWSAMARIGTLNRGGPVDAANSLTSLPRDFSEFDVSNSRPLYGGRLTIGLGYHSKDSTVERDSESDLAIYAKWSGKYR